MTERTTNSKRDVFLLRGSGSSGTNWAGALLNLHPHIHCTGEWCFEAIRAGVERWEAQAWTFGGSRRMREIARRKLAETARECLNAEADREKPGARIVGDRSPEAVREIVPGAPVILTVRDGRDVLVSMTLRYLREDAGLAARQDSGLAARPDAGLAGKRSAMVEGWEGMRGVSERFCADPQGFIERREGLLPDEAWVRRCARRWADRVTADVAAVGEMGDRGLVVRYEAMHADVERERARMQEFLGVDPSLAAPVSDETRTSAGFDREDAGSFYRAGRVGDWMGWMDDAARAWFEEEAGEALERLGYEVESDVRKQRPSEAAVAGI